MVERGVHIEGALILRAKIRVRMDSRRVIVPRRDINPVNREFRLFDSEEHIRIFEEGWLVSFVKQPHGSHNGFSYREGMEVRESIRER